MPRNGRKHPSRPSIEVRQGGVTHEEAAAIAAAIEQFLRDTAPPPRAGEPPATAWKRAGLLEGAGLRRTRPSVWGDPEPWGRDR